MIVQTYRSMPDTVVQKLVDASRHFFGDQAIQRYSMIAQSTLSKSLATSEGHELLLQEPKKKVSIMMG